MLAYSARDSAPDWQACPSILRVYLGLDLLKSMQEDVMISKITSRAACLAELTSNPKSFFNCPDLHGGVPGLPGGSRPMMPYIVRSCSGRIRARPQPDPKSVAEPNFVF